jgi:hypothetical protein
MLSIGIIVYVAFCLLTGVCGIQRRMGFFGTFLLTLILTPPVMLLVLLLTGPSHRHLHHFR